MLTTDTSLVVIEGPAFGAKGRAVFDIAGMRGVITHSLWMDGMPYVEVPPSVLKKYVTGKGNANKDAMIAAAIRSLGFEGFDNNEADAWCLLHMASQHYDYGDAVKPAYRAEMLAKVDWPTF
jgi:crossover junction endodeoxyribonuclease RuvC